MYIQRLFTLLSLSLSLSVAHGTTTVFLMGGQSNMEGWQDLSGFPTDVQSPITSVPFYTGNTSSPVANTLTYIQGNTSQISRTGPELAFAHALTDATSSPFAIIKYARGSTSLYTDWAAGGDATTTGDATQYVNLQNTVTSGLAAMQAAQPSETFQIGGFLWTQGERDANQGQTTAQYETNLTNFFDDVRLTYGSDLPIFYSTLSDSQTALTAAERANIVDAQVNVEALSPNNHLINTDGFTSDGIHFDGNGYTALGTAFADSVIAAEALSVSGPPEQLFLDITNFSFDLPDQGGDGGFSVATPTGWTNLGGTLGTINFNAGVRYTTADADDANPSGGTIGDMDGNQALFTINNGGVSQ
ncbi:MAG: sialate O-acetylesterase, partial [Akkermansiaceae bacterium]|nr:sialate O-acetylesterase [Akkermansiaceae bacterium]